MEVPAGGEGSSAWVPRYSLVSGALPMSDLPVQARESLPPRRWARFDLDVSTGGVVRLGLDHPEGLEVWVDGRRVEPAGTIDVELEAGRHVVKVAAEPDRAEPTLAVELLDAPGSPARTRPVLGR